MTDSTPKLLRRSRTDRVLGGVCGGLARYLGIDPVAARVLYVVGSFLTGGGLILGYAILWIVIPEEPITPGWPTNYAPTNYAPTNYAPADSAPADSQPPAA
jgi:phage shock protein C